jgi:hypothetical protein
MRAFVGSTLCAAVALIGVASAQVAPSPASPIISATPARDAMVSYAAFQADVTDLAARQISSAAELDAALDRVARHNREAYVRGWVAYGASVAAQSPEFVNGIREAAAQFGRDQVVGVISTHKSYARGTSGGAQATQAVLNAIMADATRIASVADRYQDYSYQLQRQAWANAVAPAQGERLRRVRDLSQPGAFTPVLPPAMTSQLALAPLSVRLGADSTALGGRHFWQALSGAPVVVEVASRAPAPSQAAANRVELINRMTSVAALQALAIADSLPAMVSDYLNDPRSRDCLEMAQLQLQQCLSSARFQFENAFCLAQHGLRDVGACMSSVAQIDAAAMTPIIPTQQNVPLSPLEGSETPG